MRLLRVAGLAVLASLVQAGPGSTRHKPRDPDADDDAVTEEEEHTAPDTEPTEPTEPRRPAKAAADAEDSSSRGRAWKEWAGAEFTETAGPPARRREILDEEVLGSQRYYSSAWRDHFNKGDASYCGAAYLEDAALHVSLGPAASELKRLLNLGNPAVFNGRSAITHFWNATMTKLGLKDLHAFEDDGDFASSALVVDDDTVVVAGPFQFNALKGLVLSAQWVRLDKEWKIRSEMLQIQENLGLSKLVKKVSPVARIAADADAAIKAAAARGTAAGSSHFSLLLMFVVAICGIAAFLVRRSKRRREATIAGFEAMLG